MFTHSTFLNNRAVNAPIGSAASSTLVFNETVIEGNLAIASEVYFTETFICVEFCFIEDEFKDKTHDIFNITQLSASKVELVNIQSTISFDNNTRITSQNAFLSCFFGTVEFKNSLLDGNNLISEPFITVIRSTLAFTGSSIRNIATSSDLLFISATEQSTIAVAQTSIEDVSFSASLVDSVCQFTVVTMRRMDGTLATMSGSTLSITSSNFKDLQTTKEFLDGNENSTLNVMDSTFENFSSRSVAKFEDSQVISSNTTYKANNTQRELNGTRHTRAFEIYTSVLTMTGNKFEHLASDIGGAIYTSNSNGTLNGNTFMRNTANLGGAFAFSCDMNQICQANLDENTFTRNTAVEGGAIHYDLFKPHISTTNVLTANIADYGEDYSSYPAYLEFPDASLLTGIASGQTIPHTLAFRVLDFDRQVMNMDNTSALIINSDQEGLSVTGEN